MVGMRVLELVAPEVRDVLTKNMRLGVEKAYETTGLRKNGSTFPVEVRRKPIKYKGKTVILGTFRDISEQKNSEATIRENEEKYRNLFENAQVGIFRTRLSDGLILEANQRIVEMFGLDSKGEVIGRQSVVDYYADPETQSHLLDVLKKKAKVKNFETKFDGFVKSRRDVIPGLIRYPEPIENI